MRLEFEAFQLSRDAMQALFRGICIIAINYDVESVQREFNKFGIKTKIVE